MSNKLEATFGVGPEDEPESLGQFIRRTGPYVTGQVIPQRIAWSRAEDFNALREELNQPLLGLASTRDLLNEVAVRMEVHGESEIEGSAAATLRVMLDVLPASVLRYKTVGDCSQEDCQHAPDGGSHPVVGRG